MMKSHEIKDRFIAGNVIDKAEWIENQDVYKRQVNIEGFQSIQPYYNGYFDVVSSNIPFGNIRIYDRDFEDVYKRQVFRAVETVERDRFSS